MHSKHLIYNKYWDVFFANCSRGTTNEKNTGFIRESYDFKC